MSKDLFSKQADIYAKYRPRYPEALIHYIIAHVAEKNAAWDCATGNGQAAVMLSPHFKQVEATDISQKQIDNAVQLANINYSVSQADSTGFPNQNFDLITVAQAYHWFNFDAFAQEAKRVLKPAGVLAIWGYSLVESAHPALNEVIRHFYTETVGNFWDPERRFVDDHYSSVPFPFDELPAAEFKIACRWNIDDITGYLNTWSSVQHFINKNGFNPVDELKPQLEAAWPGEDIVSFEFPLFLRLGRKLQ